MDFSGDIVLQLSGAGNVTTSDPDKGMIFSVSFTNAPSINELAGEASDLGISKDGKGLDFFFFEDNISGKEYYGVSFSKSYDIFFNQNKEGIEAHIGPVATENSEDVYNNFDYFDYAINDYLSKLTDKNSCI